MLEVIILNFKLNFRSDLFQLLPYTNSSSFCHISSEKSTLPLSKIVKYNIEQLPTSLIVNLIVVVISLFIPIDLIYAWYRNKCNELLLNETMENGTRPKVEVPIEEFVPRSLVVNSLKKIFTPNKYQSFYYIICGEYGTGKTTLVKTAAKEVGQGVIYVNIPTNINQNSQKFDILEDFGVAFEKALNFKFEEHISFTAQFIKKILGNNNEKSNQPKWKRAYKT
ncbi:hypothetical protein Glove_637g7 [Diversispora epigaea]|uniref:ATPase AAA-type core domain-containing protein n=1 Tax=Diversispora epigaea TaxID=1348612 RepID=A0A397G4Z6_9GLOM|nr:hypothetical protein Glove_637g7 [Diversispora epigaea]